MAQRGVRAGMPLFLGMLAEYHLKLGQYSQGLAAVTHALEWADTLGERSYEVELYRIEGELPRVDQRLAWTEVARVMWDSDAPVTNASLTRKATGLRQQFQRSKTHLRQLAIELGLLEQDQPPM